MRPVRPYAVGNRVRHASPGVDGTIYYLADHRGRQRVEIWPAGGFNCYKWVTVRQGGVFNLLYADPKFLAGAPPTRSGIPILFPFPNRIRDGRFTWDSKAYQLTANDPAQKNAIHGFACRRPWRVVDLGAKESSAWITGEFQGSRDAPECRDLWPGDYQIRITYRLSSEDQRGVLRLEAVVHNPDRVPLPFGLGFHHYFRVNPNQRIDGFLMRAPARSFWELRDNLPTGRILPVDGTRNLNAEKTVESLALDDVLTDLPEPPGQDGLCFRSSINAQPGGWGLEMHTSPAFRELVAFTPVHRQAIALEPYTCTTDAINLQQRGVEAGWLVLPPGETWTGVVEMVVSGG